MIEEEKKAKKCSVGLIDAYACGNIKPKAGDDEILRTVKINDLDDKVSHLFSTLNNNEIDQCSTVVTYRESWVISQRLGNQLPGNSNICERHRQKYGKNF